MNKSLVILLLALLCTNLPQNTICATRFEQSAARKAAIAQEITWPNHEPLMFYLRRGKMAENWPEIYERQHTPQNIARMAEVGVTYGRLHFYKGLGIGNEMPGIRRSMAMADLMRGHGMRVSVYVAGTMFIEPFYAEVPEAKNWEQRDQDGKWIPYSGTQTFRHFACQNEPAYSDYIKKVIKIGVDSVKVDQFFFDNIFVKPEPKSCRCNRCIDAFHTFLKKKYPTPGEAFRRFGYRDVSIIRPNEWDLFNQPFSLTVIDDPVLQEWMRFRCETLANQCGDFYDYIKSLNPDISVGFNLKGLYGENRYWRAGVYHPLFEGRCDWYPFDTGGMDARLDEETGALVTEIRSFKCARTLNMGCTSGGSDLEYAVFMAFNNQKFVPGYGYLGGPSDRGANRVFTPLTEFFREYNDRYYRGTRSVADVAVLRSWPSMAYSIWPTLVPTILTEQVLIQHKIPFDIIFDEQIDRIGNFKAVILPGQESLSMLNIEKLTAYVRDGGTLVFTDNTAQLNKWRERREHNPLLALMNLDSAPEQITVAAAGKGKMVYIPRVVPDSPGEDGEEVDIFAEDRFTAVADAAASSGRPFPSSLWLLPKNHLEIRDAIVANLAGELSLQTGAPQTTVAELLNREESKETILHIVNFEQQKRLRPFEVKVLRQYDRSVKEVKLFSPESDEPQKLAFKDDGTSVRFSVPETGLYTMLVISH